MKENGIDVKGLSIDQTQSGRLGSTVCTCLWSCQRFTTPPWGKVVNIISPSYCLIWVFEVY